MDCRIDSAIYESALQYGIGGVKHLSHVVSDTNAVNNASWLEPLCGRSPQYILI
jgi:hypothetical protein